MNGVRLGLAGWLEGWLKLGWMDGMGGLDYCGLTDWRRLKLGLEMGMGMEAT